MCVCVRGEGGLIGTKNIFFWQILALKGKLLHLSDGFAWGDIWVYNWFLDQLVENTQNQTSSFWLVQRNVFFMIYKVPDFFCSHSTIWNKWMSAWNTGYPPPPPRLSLDPNRHLCQTQMTRSVRISVRAPVRVCDGDGVWGGGSLLDIQHVVEIGDVAYSQSEDLDLGEFLVRG